MRLLLLSTIAFICAALTVFSQSFSVFDVDASQFPLMKAKFYAFDANQQPAAPSKTEIQVSEEGVSRTVISVTCQPPQPVAPLSIAFGVDVSGSMLRTDGGEAPIELTKTT